MDPHVRRPLALHEVAALLDEARRRTLMLVAPLSDEDLRRQHDPLMSPIVWDLGHIAHFEEVWLLEKLEEQAPAGEGLRGIYDPFRHPRATRDALELPGREEALTYLGRVRRTVLERLARADLDRDAPLLRDGFVFRMVLQHEYQHDETILQTLQLKRGCPYPAMARAEAPPVAADAPPPGSMVRFPGVEVTIGTDDRSAAYDNERPRHTVRLAPFEIGAHPVTNGEYLRFVQEGGYDDASAWSPEGWAWRREAGLEAPLYWSREPDGWRERVMDRVAPLDPRAPVCHVCYWEADAFARWSGLRLPTEQEWEAAASWDPRAGSARTWPWGETPPDPDRANLDALVVGRTPVGCHPRGVSPIGCWDMIGNVWEWTSSTFQGWPGYRTFPYPEYSEVFFGEEYRVLRGGSWATRPGAVRNTFRNWDYPIRRQIFSGFRCARDA